MKRFCWNTQKVEEFEKYGFWANGQIAYSKITIENGVKVVKEGDEGTYYQVRCYRKMVMFHI